MVKKILILFFCALKVVLFPFEGHAQIYRYTDESGVVHFTDDISRLQRNSFKFPIETTNTVKIQKFRIPSVVPAVLKEKLFSDEIYRASLRYGIDSSLIKAIIKAESAFDPLAISKKGAIGLMQLIPSTAKHYDVKNSFDPEQNINGGVKYLKFLFSFFKGNLKKVIAAYNAGENNVMKYNGIPPFKETRNFVKRVTAYYKKFKAQDTSSSKIARLVLRDGTVMYTDSPSLYLTLK